MSRTDIRFALPSKGRLEPESLAFLDACGLNIYKPNPRQYQAKMSALPELTVIFQRPGDIVVSVRDGSVDFGITGIDVLEEKRGRNGDVLVLHDALGFGHCALMLAVPEAWIDVDTMADVVDVSLDFREHNRRAIRIHDLRFEAALFQHACYEPGTFLQSKVLRADTWLCDEP